MNIVEEIKKLLDGMSEDEIRQSLVNLSLSKIIELKDAINKSDKELVFNIITGV